MAFFEPFLGLSIEDDQYMPNFDFPEGASSERRATANNHQTDRSGGDDFSQFVDWKSNTSSDHSGSSCVPLTFPLLIKEDSSLMASLDLMSVAELDYSNPDFEHLLASGDGSTFPADESAMGVIVHAKELNSEYQRSLMKLMNKLELMLAENRDAQRKATESIEVAGGKKCKRGEKTIRKYPWVQQFLHPYFKDDPRCGMEPPSNSDTLRMKDEKMFDGLKPFPKTWTKGERDALIKGVLRETIDQTTNRLTQKLIIVSDKIDRITNDIKTLKLDQQKKEGQQIDGNVDEDIGLESEARKDREKIELKKKELEELKWQEVLLKIKIAREKKSIQRAATSPRFADYVVSVDWESVAKHELKEMRTAEECELMWENDVRCPNGSRWTEDEDRRLKKLVEIGRTKDWEVIPLLLKIDKTPFQCFEKYRTKLDRSVSSDIKTQQLNEDRVWTNKERNLLKQLARDYKIGTFVDWDQVAACLNEGMVPLDTERMLWERSEVQVEEKAKSEFSETHQGAWSLWEDLDLLILVNKLSHRNWALVGKEMNKNAKDCRSRWQLLMKNYDDLISWKKTEYRRLRIAVRLMGQNQWEEVGRFLVRSAESCRIEYGKSYIPKEKKRNILEEKKPPKRRGRPRKVKSEGLKAEKSEPVQIKRGKVSTDIKIEPLAIVKTVEDTKYEEMCQRTLNKKNKVGKMLIDKGLMEEDAVELVEALLQIVTDPVIQGLMMAIIRSIVFEDLDD